MSGGERCGAPAESGTAPEGAATAPRSYRRALALRRTAFFALPSPGRGPRRERVAGARALAEMAGE